MIMILTKICLLLRHSEQEPERGPIPKEEKLLALKGFQLLDQKHVNRDNTAMSSWTGKRALQTISCSHKVFKFNPFFQKAVHLNSYSLCSHLKK